nr:pilus motility taxis protein HmpF [Myxacorys almedinensis]
MYLAEVIQKKGGIMGGGKSELKLLACQRTEQNWSAVSGDESVQADEASRYGAGTLLLVDLTASKQVQRIQEAGRPLVSILQNFSRLQERFKTQEEEIEQWKQSLTYQSQELNRREMEMEARQEQLQQIEADLEQLEQQRQEFEATRQEVTTQQQEMERQRQEMQGAWDQLQGQKQQLEERQAELLGASVLDDEKAQVIHHLLEQLCHGGTSLDEMHTHLQQIYDVLGQQQTVLTHHWQMLEQHQQTAHQLQEETEQQAQILEQQWQAWHQAQETVEQTKSEAKSEESVLHAKQEYAQCLKLQLERYGELHQKLSQVAAGGVAHEAVQIDLHALENLPLEELRSLIKTLQKEFDQSSQFVHGQEEELDLKEKELEALRTKIQQVSEFDRISLEAELTDEQDAYQFLNETLVGQRRSLIEKEGILRQHRAVLARKTGKPDPTAVEGGIDVSPVLAAIEAQRQQQALDLQTVESQIDQLRHAIQQAQEWVNPQIDEQQTKRYELRQLEDALKTQRASVADVVAKVALYQEMLQPLQDAVTGTQQSLDAIAALLSCHQKIGVSHQQTVEQMRQVVSDLSLNLPMLKQD